MKRNGFTLIELLAVIVILAIIALIATPIILNIIKDAKEESQERSIELYASAAKNAVAKYQLNNTTAPTSFEQLEIEYDGDVVCTTEELYSDGSIYLAGCSVNGDVVDYTYGTKQGETSNSGETQIVCRAATTKQVTYEWGQTDDPSLASSFNAVEVGSLPSEVENKYAYGVTYMCDPGDGTERAFLVLEDGDNTALTKGDFSTTHYETQNLGTAGAGEVALIMAENIGSSAWCEQESATCNGYTAVATLQSLTSTWTVDVNLPTYAQVKQANGGSETNLATWTLSNLYGAPANPYGYWLSTTADYEGVYPYNVWNDSSNGGNIESAPMATESHGVRPVITVSKAQIQ